MYLQNKHWQNFKVINLEENHRQGDDRVYADVPNRIRIGEQTESDIELLKTRVRQPSDSDIIEAKDAIYISAKNKEVKKINDKFVYKFHLCSDYINHYNITKGERNAVYASYNNNILICPRL